MDYSVILVRYGEVGLKSRKVRSRFEKKLVKNIKSSFDCDIFRDQGRIYIYPLDFDFALDRLNKIFGIVSYSPAVFTKANHEDIECVLKDYADSLVDKGILSEDTSFAIKCRRVGDHSFTSQEMAAFCGSVVVENVGSCVDLTNPDLVIYVEVRDDKAFIFHEKIQGPGGLPLGTQGKVISLISSGIDSPVATYLMMKRGCEVIALHFRNDPFTESKAEVLFDRLIDRLQEYASGVPIKKYVVPYGEYLAKCRDDGPERMTCVLCKLGMYRVAEAIAKQEDLLAVVDGSSVGQVASQTLSNILATRYGVDIPILSPLIGLDKLEIERIAESIGTFEISKIDDGGCSAVPRYPETNADLVRVSKACEDICQDDWILKLVGMVEK